MKKTFYQGHIGFCFGMLGYLPFIVLGVLGVVYGVKVVVAGTRKLMEDDHKTYHRKRKAKVITMRQIKNYNKEFSEIQYTMQTYLDSFEEYIQFLFNKTCIFAYFMHITKI